MCSLPGVLVSSPICCARGKHYNILRTNLLQDTTVQLKSEKKKILLCILSGIKAFCTHTQSDFLRTSISIFYTVHCKDFTLNEDM